VKACRRSNLCGKEFGAIEAEERRQAEVQIIESTVLLYFVLDANDVMLSHRSIRTWSFAVVKRPSWRERAQKDYCGTQMETNIWLIGLLLPALTKMLLDRG